MILLPKTYYGNVSEPLKDVKVNHLFARAVVEKKVRGSLFVDDPEDPSVFYVVHPYGMSLLFGARDSEGFNNKLKDYLLNTNRERNGAEWLQAYPGDWNTKISELLDHRLIKAGITGNPAIGMVEENTRVNFRFNRSKYLVFRRNIKNCAYAIVHTSHELYGEMKGSVVPQYFWDSADDFCRYGVGFTLLVKEKPVSTAYSAYISGNQLEMGIETMEAFRGKGFALHTCSSLIDYCLENNYEPVWSCRMENAGSFKLAHKLGFEPTVTLPYYRLPV